MKVSYKKLWKLLIDKDMNKTDLRHVIGLSTSTIAKMTRGDDITTAVLTRICESLKWNVGGIDDFILEDIDEARPERVD